MVSIWQDICLDSWGVLLFITTGKAGMASDKTFLQLTPVIGPMDGEENKYSKHKASAPNEKTESHILINFHPACQRLRDLKFGSNSELRGE